MNLFEKAIRGNYRFSCAKRSGMNVEDLLALHLTSKNGPSLDGVGRNLLTQIKEQGEVESLVEDVSTKSDELQSKLDLVKLIIAEKKAANAAKSQAAALQQQKALVREELSKRKTNDLLSGSTEELEAFLNS